MSSSDRRPLDGVRVVDLTHVLAGPYCTYQLGLLGADVIKVEPLRGDLVRAWGGTSEQMQAGMGTGYVSQNAGKRCIAVDLNTAEGCELVRALIAEADVFVENYRPGTNDARGFGPDDLASLNPRLIHVSIAASTGETPAPAGNRDAPLLGRYATADGWVMLAGYLPRHQRALLSALGLDELANLSGGELAARGDEIDAAAEAALLTKSAAEWDRIFAEAGAVGGGVRDLGEVIASGQPEARALLSEVDTATGTSQVTNVGYLLNGEAFAPRHGVGSIGEDSRSVCAEVGYGQAEIDRLIADGVVGEPE